MFQSRNRDAFRFKIIVKFRGGITTGMFQSRNRDAFRFKCSVLGLIMFNSNSFNLVIEMLFVSSADVSVTGNAIRMFQSRNRDAFRFKQHKATLHASRLPSFNLVIERLFVSS